MHKELINILLVEDNPGDADLITELFEEIQTKSKITNVHDGQEAINFLLKKECYKDVQIPDLIILDLNLPKMDGRLVLKEIKSSTEFKSIPIIIMTSSKNQKDINYSYELGANSYVTKKLELNSLKEDIKSITKFWLDTVELPNQINELQ